MEEEKKIQRRRRRNGTTRSWRLSAQAAEALVILEAEQPDKSQAQLIGELLIAQANKADVPTPINFAEFDDAEWFSLRAALAENAQQVKMARAMNRKASLGSDKDGSLALEARKQMELVVRNCNEINKKVQLILNQSASIKAEQIMSFEEVYQRASILHQLSVKKYGTDPDAPERAKVWADLANFARIYYPKVGPEIKTPVPFVAEKGIQISQIGGGDA